MNKSDQLKPNPFERSQPLTRDYFDIPLLGMVRVDHPSLSSGDYNLSELVSNFKNENNHSVTLEVLDDAMHQAGIIKGDFLTIDLHTHPCDGDIVAVKLGERFYIRRYHKQGHRILLLTADSYPSSLVVEDNTPGFLLFGKVISLSRQF